MASPVDSPGIRRRQVDIDKPLQIIWMKNDDVKNQAETLQQVFSSRSPHKPITSEARKQNHQLLKNQTRKVSLKASIGEVATPSVRNVESSQIGSYESFVRPVSYIHFYEPPYDFDTCNYQLDDQDDDFLELWNETVKNERSLQLNEDQFEEIITLFENLTYQHHRSVRFVQGLAKGPNQDDINNLFNVIDNTKFTRKRTKGMLLKLKQTFLSLQGLSCEVCAPDKQKFYSQDTIFLRCSICDAVCHQSCYYDQRELQSKNSVIFQNNSSGWKCDRCSVEITDFEMEHSIDDDIKGQRECCLCFRNKGLLRCVSDEDKSYGSFAHIVCAQWLEDSVIEPSYDGKVNGIRFLRPHRWNSICKVCNEHGVCIQCNSSHCRNFYHPYCAQQVGCSMDHKSKTFYCSKHTKEQNEKTDHHLKPSPILTDIQFEVLSATVKEKSEEILTKSTLISKTSTSTTKNNIHNSTTTGSTTNNNNNTNTNNNNNNNTIISKKRNKKRKSTINSKKKKTKKSTNYTNNYTSQSSSLYDIIIPKIVFEVMFYYWKCKRNRVQSFLIPQLDRMLEEEQDVLGKSKKGKKHRVDEQESLNRIIQMRKDLEYARILLDRVHKREQLKLEWLEESQKLFEYRFLKMALEAVETDNEEEISSEIEITESPSSPHPLLLETDDEDEIILLDSDSESNTENTKPEPEPKSEPEPEPPLPKPLQKPNLRPKRSTTITIPKKKKKKDIKKKNNSSPKKPILGKRSPRLREKQRARKRRKTQR